MEEKRKVPHDEENTAPSPKRRVLGPTLPPQAEDNSANDSGSGSNSDSDDDFGPSMPPPAGQSIAPPIQSTPTTTHTPSEDKKQKPESSRDQWMLHPPESSDWASKIDPTQLRNRKFQTGKSARSGGASKDLDASWTETPEERMRRLEDKMMGVGAAPSGAAPPAAASASPLVLFMAATGFQGQHSTLDVELSQEYARRMAAQGRD